MTATRGPLTFTLKPTPGGGAIQLTMYHRDIADGAQAIVHRSYPTTKLALTDAVRFDYNAWRRTQEPASLRRAG